MNKIMPSWPCRKTSSSLAVSTFSKMPFFATFPLPASVIIGSLPSLFLLVTALRKANAEAPHAFQIQFLASISNVDRYFHRKVVSLLDEHRRYFPNQVKYAPGFDLVNGDSFNNFEEAMYRSRPIHIEATFEGRFDSASTVENGKRIEVGKGYGKRHKQNGQFHSIGTCKWD